MSTRVGSKVHVVLWITLGACSFAPPPANIDGAMDVPRESIGEDPPSARYTEDLVGFWTFNEASGPVANDTSGTGMTVPLTALEDADHDLPVFAGGRVTAATRSRLQSEKNNHLPVDCEAANAVTLEAWVAPNPALQGSLAEPVFIAGLAKSVTDRDVVLLQADGAWLGRVRTGAADGTPNLLSTSVPTTAWTHLVVVASATARTLYVNNVAEATTVGGGLGGWDTSVAMQLFEEPQNTRHWTGSIALVALYARELTAAQVEQNFIAGPDSP